MRWNFTILAFLAIATVACIADEENVTKHKIGGVNFVGTAKPITQDAIHNIKKINANWISFTPYSFCSRNNPEITFNSNWQWWGEKTDGIKECINFAKAENLKIMLKPHIWVKEDGWAGDLTYTNEADWKKWEDSYRKYILHYAELAEANKIDLFCIGTEIRKSVVSRKAFWFTLIQEIRTVYKGKLTYAANWDNYKNVPFWPELDYMGVDAYFPISLSEQPTPDQLRNGWSQLIKELKTFSDQYNRPILFTEYGYRSATGCAGKHWEIPDPAKVDLDAQTNAYTALYKSVWDKDWFAGGFLWKWFPDINSGGTNNSDFTPQNKPVEKVIAKYYLD